MARGWAQWDPPAGSPRSGTKTPGGMPWYLTSEICQNYNLWKVWFSAVLQLTLVTTLVWLTTARELTGEKHGNRIQNILFIFSSFRTFIELHGRPSPPIFHHRTKDNGLSWSTYSHARIKTYRLLYRKVKLLNTVHLSTYCPFYPISHLPIAMSTSCPIYSLPIYHCTTQCHL